MIYSFYKYHFLQASVYMSPSQRPFLTQHTCTTTLIQFFLLIPYHYNYKISANLPPFPLLNCKSQEVRDFILYTTVSLVPF